MLLLPDAQVFVYSSSGLSRPGEHNRLPSPSNPDRSCSACCCCCSLSSAMTYGLVSWYGDDVLHGPLSNLNSGTIAIQALVVDDNASETSLGSRPTDGKVCSWWTARVGVRQKNVSYHQPINRYLVSAKFIASKLRTNCSFFFRPLSSHTNATTLRYTYVIRTYFRPPYIENVQ